MPVWLEALKTIDVQDTNKTFRASILPNGTIDFINKPRKRKTTSQNGDAVFFFMCCIRNAMELITMKKMALLCYQSNKREYIVFARPSLLTVAL